VFITVETFEGHASIALSAARFNSATVFITVETLPLSLQDPEAVLLQFGHGVYHRGNRAVFPVG